MCTEIPRKATVRSREVPRARITEGEREWFKDNLAKILESSESCVQHPYLESKGLSNAITRCYTAPDSNRYIVVPIYGKAGRQALALIDATGHTTFMRNGGLAGCYSRLGPRPEKSTAICIVTGYATGLSVLEATGYSTAVAWVAKNLRNVAKALRELYPGKAIMVCADAGHENSIEAEAAACEIDARLIRPSSSTRATKDFADFNCMHSILGIEVLRHAIIPNLLIDGLPKARESDEAGYGITDLIIDSGCTTEPPGTIGGYGSRAHTRADAPDREERINGEHLIEIPHAIPDAQKEERYKLIRQLGSFIREHMGRFAELYGTESEQFPDLLGWRVKNNAPGDTFLFTADGLREALQGCEFRLALNQLECAGVIPRAGADGKRARVMRVGGLPRRIYSIDACKLHGEASAKHYETKALDIVTFRVGASARDREGENASFREC